MLQAMIVSCRRSGPPERTAAAGDGSSSRAAWLSVSAGLAVLAAGDQPGGCVLRNSATSDLIAASGSGFKSRLSTPTEHLQCLDASALRAAACAAFSTDRS